MRSWGVSVAFACAVLAGTVAASAGDGAHASFNEWCDRTAAASELRRDRVTGTGPRIAVIGDSYSQGLGLGAPADSWPSRLDGRVVVDGFAGSGFSEGASGCSGVAFGDRVARALATEPDLVVVQGGLNDSDRTDEAITAGAQRVLSGLSGEHVVVVGPPTAPRRADAVERVDALLAEVAEEAGVAYVRTADWELEYLPDRLHLTPAGHRALGDRVASAVAQLG